MKSQKILTRLFLLASAILLYIMLRDSNNTTESNDLNKYDKPFPGRNK